MVQSCHFSSAPAPRPAPKQGHAPSAESPLRRPRPQASPRPGPPLAICFRQNPQHDPPEPRLLLTLKGGSCPSGARCSSRTSSIAFSQNMTDAPLSYGFVLTPNSRWPQGRKAHVAQFPTAPILCLRLRSVIGAKRTRPIGAQCRDPSPTAAAKEHLSLI